ncbi:MAG: tRNA modification GTPase [Planctomycetaceae bacterium]|nr:tRNA modification GTPase [Planctomycetaceae bacterium]
MKFDTDDTIVAIASPTGAAVRGIVRISGDRVVEAVRSVFRATESGQGWPAAKVPRRTVGEVLLCKDNLALPAALMFWPGTRSYTGRPMAELHVPGIPPLLDLLVEQLLLAGIRPAERGEFTMRAFLNGRITLVQAEAVLGVIDAADHEELQTALLQLSTGLTGRLTDLRRVLIALLGDLEAGLDFVDEDIEFVSRDQIRDRLNLAAAVLSELLNEAERRIPSGRRPRVVLAGLPNAGKSTLFNRLIGRQKAIVSDIPGTTRDYLSADIQASDVAVELIDTAGWETAHDQLMMAAQDHRSEQLTAGDVILWCTAANLPPEERLTNEKLCGQTADTERAPLIRVVTQCDLRESSSSKQSSPKLITPATADFAATHSEDAEPTDIRAVSVSAVTGDGLEHLLQQIASSLTTAGSSRTELLATTATRCRESLRQALLAVRHAQTNAADHSGDELIAFELRDTLHHLAAILGEVYTDDLLDHIFSNFCIGK